MKRSARLHTRLTHLDQLAKGDRKAYGTSVAALQHWYDCGGSSSATIRIRASFLTPVGDDGKSPLTRLITSRGHALRFALLTLFLAQTSTRPNRHILPLRLAARDSDEIAWADLVVSPATDGKGSASRGAREKRVASARKALDRLAAPDISLVRKAATGSRVGRYDNVQLNQDSGPRPVGEEVRYTLPRGNERTVSIPVSFFLKGWIFALEDAEIAVYLMYRLLCAEMSPQPAHISDTDRKERFGISRAAWEQLWVLVDSGILEIEDDPNRRADGTVIDQRLGVEPRNHRVILRDAGLASDAIHEVWRAVDHRSGQAPN